MPSGCDHARDLETSLSRRLNESGVHHDRIKGAIPEDMPEISGAGALGEPELATAEKGERAFEHAVTRMLEMTDPSGLPASPTPRGRTGHSTAVRVLTGEFDSDNAGKDAGSRQSNEFAQRRLRTRHRRRGPNSPSAMGTS